MKRSSIASFIVTTIAVSMAATVCGDKPSLSQLSLLDLEPAYMLTLQEKIGEAIAHYEQALRLKPDRENWRRPWIGSRGPCASIPITPAPAKT
jgi:hypothetical protein